MARTTAGAASSSRRGAGRERASEAALVRRARTSSATSRDGTRLVVRSAGPPDGPVVVLVHGLGLSVESWDGVAAALARTLRVITYDLRGHGESGRAVGGDYSLEAHADDLAAVLRDAVPAGAAPVVAGHSLGGAIIIAHARAASDGRIAGAVFVGSGGSSITVPGLPGRRLPGWARRRLRTAWYGILRGATVLGRRI
ncbi:alpha/beta fold hydrolase, partial [Georgenia sp. 10Sc9-8]|nr:alpha/beta fold hydrolase [Georgenia halotolerans]